MKNRLIRPLILAATVGFIAGAAWLVAIRMATFKSDTVHYHANFALYVNGQRDEFKNFTFYEEVQSCGASDTKNAKIRVHMHDSKNHVVHVHDNNVTWGAFFDNLGYTLGNTVLKTDDGVYVSGADNKKLQFVLNGKPVETVSNRVITSKDSLLISYDTDDQALIKKQYEAIPKNAGEFNLKNDPGTCSGSKKLTPKDRLIQALGIGSSGSIGH